MLPNLNTLREFRYLPVIKSFQRNYGVSEDDANKLFDNVMRYLWISRKHEQDRSENPDDTNLQFTFVMHEEMRSIDNMWHEFILHTQAYMDFCQQYFGHYLHHLPNIAETLIHTEGEFSLEMEKYLSYVFDNLGEKTVREWFSMHLS